MNLQESLSAQPAEAAEVRLRSEAPEGLFLQTARRMFGEQWLSFYSSSADALFTVPTRKPAAAKETPATHRNAASTPPKQPAPNAAFCRPTPSPSQAIIVQAQRIFQKDTHAAVGGVRIRSCVAAPNGLGSGSLTRSSDVARASRLPLGQSLVRDSCLARTVPWIPILRECSRGFPPGRVRERILAPAARSMIADCASHSPSARRPLNLWRNRHLLIAPHSVTPCWVRLAI